nr:MAG TPA: hypothetical protein [Caudoviricetes sp.]
MIKGHVATSLYALKIIIHTHKDKTHILKIIYKGG